MLSYVEKTQVGRRPQLARPTREQAGDILFIDAATRASLEINQTLSGQRQGSLIATIDRTQTGAGARLLAERIRNPLAATNEIRRRHDSIAALLELEGNWPQLAEQLVGRP